MSFKPAFKEKALVKLALAARFGGDSGTLCKLSFKLYGKRGGFFYPGE
jgi:hypothetical protein